MTALTNAPVSTESTRLVREPLRVISGSQRRRAYVVGGLVGAVVFALCAVLVHMNLALAEQSRELRNHARDLKTLSEEETLLRKRVADQQTPQSICEKAKTLGMVPLGTASHLSLQDGSIIGQKHAEKALTAPC